MMIMQIGTPKITIRDGMARIAAMVSSADGDAQLWFGVAPEHAGALLGGRADGFVVALLLRAMQLGEGLRMAAPLCSRLHYHLVHHYQPLMQVLYPGLRQVRIEADLVEVVPDGAVTGVGTGFSAGIDSFAVIHDHLLAPVPASFRLTHLTFNNVGSHGTRDPARARHLFHQRYAAIRGYPQDIGLPFIAVDSNLAELLPMDFELTHTTRNMAVALVLQGLFRRFYYASTFQYRDLAVVPTYDSALVDPVALPLLSSGSLDLVAVGSQYTRIEKTRLVAEVPGAERWLNVCATESLDGRNCSQCMKCCRVLYTLEMLGLLERFAGVFDLTRWQRERNRYVVTKLLAGGRKRPLTAEILVHARAQGHRFTPAQRCMALLLRPVPRPLYRLGRSLRRRVTG